MEAETEECLRSSVNHECTETEVQADARQKRRRKEWVVPFSSVASSASVELTTKLPSVNQYRRKRKRKWKDEPSPSLLPSLVRTKLELLLPLWQTSNSSNA